METDKNINKKDELEEEKLKAEIELLRVNILKKQTEKEEIQTRLKWSNGLFKYIIGGIVFACLIVPWIKSYVLPFFRFSEVKK